MTSRTIGTPPVLPQSRRAFMRNMATAGVGLLGANFLAACAGGSSSTGLITFSTNELPASSNPAQVKIYQDYVQTFEQNHKGVTIRGLNDAYTTQAYFTKAAARSQ